MIRPLFVAVLAVFACSCFRRSAAAHSRRESQVVDGIAAVVNGDVITYSQVRAVVGPRETTAALAVQGRGTGETNQGSAGSRRCKDLIDRQLIVQSFDKEKFELPEHFVDERVNEIIRESFGGDRQTFIKTLQAQNYSLSEFKKQEKEKNHRPGDARQERETDHVIPPAKIDEYYAKHREEFTSQGAGQTADDHDSEPRESKEMRRRRKRSRKKFSASSPTARPFDRMAQMYSEDSTRDLGGDWGWIERKTLAGAARKSRFQSPGRQSQPRHRSGRQLLHPESRRKAWRRDTQSFAKSGRDRKEADAGRSAAAAGTLAGRSPAEGLHPHLLSQSIARATSSLLVIALVLELD